MRRVRSATSRDGGRCGSSSSWPAQQSVQQSADVDDGGSVVRAGGRDCSDPCRRLVSVAVVAHRRRGRDRGRDQVDACDVRDRDSTVPAPTSAATLAPASTARHGRSRRRRRRCRRCRRQIHGGAGADVGSYADPRRPRRGAGSTVPAPRSTPAPAPTSAATGPASTAVLVVRSTARAAPRSIAAPERRSTGPASTVGARGHIDGRDGVTRQRRHRRKPDRHRQLCSSDIDADRPRRARRPCPRRPDPRTLAEHVERTAAHVHGGARIDGTGPDPVVPAATSTAAGAASAAHPRSDADRFASARRGSHACVDAVLPAVTPTDAAAPVLLSVSTPGMAGLARVAIDSGACASGRSVRGVAGAMPRGAAARGGPWPAPCRHPS